MNGATYAEWGDQNICQGEFEVNWRFDSPSDLAKANDREYNFLTRGHLLELLRALPQKCWSVYEIILRLICIKN